MTTRDLAALALAAGALATMPIYALAARGRARDPDVAGRPRTVLLGYWVRDWLMWVIAPLERLLVRQRIPPLLLNLAGVALGVAAGAAYARGTLSAAGWLVLLGGLADVLDGRLARARGLVSPAGAFLDSALDRFAETFALAGVAVYFAASPWRVLAAVLALGGSLLVSYTRARGEGLGIEFRGGVMQRAERLVLLALASLLDPVLADAAAWPPGTLLAAVIAIIGAGALGTAAYRTVAIARVLRGRGAPGP